MPLMDLMNHSFNVTSGHALTDGNVAFRLGSSGVQRGAEIFYNYGSHKGNEKLMMAYGFSTHQNIQDTYGLELTAKVQDPQKTGGQGGSIVTHRLGTFHVRGQWHPEVLAGSAHQIPLSLWKAIR